MAHKLTVTPKAISYLLITLLVSFGWMTVSQLIGAVFMAASPGTGVLSGVVFLIGEGLGLLGIFWRHRHNPQIWCFPRKHRIQSYAKGFVLGLSLFSAVWGLVVLAGGFRVVWHLQVSALAWYGLLLIGFAIQSAFEELLCRGYIMGRYLQKKQPVMALGVSTLMFVGYHGANPGFGLPAALSLLLWGFMMGLIRLIWENLWLNSAIHGAWNFAEGVLFGSAVSGNQTLPAIWQTTAKPNHTLISGGRFGIEGSVIVCAVNAMVCGVLLWVYFHKSKDRPISLYSL